MISVLWLITWCYLYLCWRPRSLTSSVLCPSVPSSVPSSVVCPLSVRPIPRPVVPRLVVLRGIVLVSCCTFLAEHSDEPILFALLWGLPFCYFAWAVGGAQEGHAFEYGKAGSTLPNDYYDFVNLSLSCECMYIFILCMYANIHNIWNIIYIYKIYSIYTIYKIVNIV